MLTSWRCNAGLLALVVVAAGCSRPTDAPPPVAASAPVVQAEAARQGIAWQHAANEAEVDAAFARAKAGQQPVFVYWGADWCPPCNQVKATLFNRQDFIERSRAFVPVYIDGDSPGAQKLGARFKVRGYPTMVLFSPAGEEITRLPGEVDAQQYTELLTLGLSAQRPVKLVLADARAGGQGLSANDWRLLAFYSWATDEQQQVVPPKQLPALLKQLADACPAEAADACTRLFLQAAAAGGPQASPKPAAFDRLLAVLRHAESSRVNMDVLSNNAAELARALSAPKTAQRQQLVDTYDACLSGLANDTTLSRADRLGALIARTQLARLDAPAKAPPAVPTDLLTEVREHVARADRETTNGYERQVVIPTAAYLLEQAGAGDASDQLLQANLASSPSAYYLMLGLAGNAKRRGDTAAALRWYEQAFERSQGPSTRLQWGATYVTALIDLAPQDEARIEKVVQQLFTEAAAQPDVFYERSARSLQRVGDKLMGWKGHAAALKRLKTQLATVCAGLPAGDGQREVCDGLLRPRA